MILIRLLRFLRGTVRLQVRGEFLERFINLLAREKVDFWDSEKTDEQFSCSVLRCDMDELSEIAERTSTEIKSVNRHGLPFVYGKYRKRIGAMFGLLIFVLFVCGMSLLVWDVQVVGNETVSESQILEFLSSRNVSKGKPVHSIDVRKVAQELVLKIEGISWAAVNIDGTQVRVEIREVTERPDMIAVSEPCDIVASADGVIRRLEVYEGKGMVMEGEAVRKGQVIASGVLNDPKGNTVFKHAKALCEAQISDVLRVEIKMSDMVESIGEAEKTEYYLNIFGWEMPLWFYSKPSFAYEQTEKKQMVNIMGVTFPFGVRICSYSRIEQISVNRTKEECKSLAKKKAAEILRNTLESARLLSQKYTDSIDNDVYVLEVNYSYIKDIAKESVILVESESESERNMDVSN